MIEHSPNPKWATFPHMRAEISNTRKAIATERRRRIVAERERVAQERAAAEWEESERERARVQALLLRARQAPTRAESHQDKYAAVVAAFTADMLKAGTHPIIAFVALYAMSLAQNAELIEVRGEIVGQDRDRLLIEVTPGPGDLPKLLGKKAAIIEEVRGMAQRMARAYGIYVEIRLVDADKGNRK